MLALLVLLADAASLMAAGDKAYAAKDFRTALFAYQDATREDPSSAIVWSSWPTPTRAWTRSGSDRILHARSQAGSGQLDRVAGARRRAGALAILSPPPKPAEPPPRSSTRRARASAIRRA